MFTDRIGAGKQLAKKLQKYREKSVLVVALPRGGVSVGYPIAQALHAPLEVLVVRKLGAPYDPEFGVGAVAEDGVVYWDNGLLEELQVSQRDLAAVAERELSELDRRKKLYREGKNLPLLTNKTVILVDDGLATGVSAHAAILSLKKHHPKKIIFAVPVCSEDTVNTLKSLVDSIVCLDIQRQLVAVSSNYHDFGQVTDEEVIKLLRKIREDCSLSTGDKNDFDHKIVW